MLIKKCCGFLVLSFLFWCSSCEKDDICVDGNTPLLVIEFYDINNEELLLPVPNLKIIGKGEDNSPVILNRESVNTVSIPLQVNTDHTNFDFIINSAGDNGEETGNVDAVAFTYNVKDVFVSRACGYVGNYLALDSDLTVELGPGNWIDRIDIEIVNVVNQAETHVKIYH